MPLSPIEIGRVCLVNYGPDEGKLVTVVDVVDSGSLLVHGPAANVKRQVIGVRRISVTPLKIKIGRSARAKSILKAWIAGDIENAWKNSAWAKRIAKQTRRKNLTDFDRFQVMLLRKQKSFAVGKELKKLKKANAKKSGKK